jgi:SAM-dependent methyltransferase
VEVYDEALVVSRRVGEELAERLLPLVAVELGGITPASLVDVGCGPGAYVRGFLKAGIDAVGWDATWAEPHLVIPRDRFTAYDLEQPLPRDRRFDIAISIEVAEHLSPQRGPGFVADLCAIADTVLFSAALPGQPGTHHVNLRWQSYWVGIFADNGFGVIDCIRPALWEATVGWVLAQQCFLFVRDVPPRLAMPINVIHPGKYQELICERGPRALIGALPGAIKRAAQRRGRRLASRSAC